VLYTALAGVVAAAELKRLAERQGTSVAGLLPRRICHIDLQLSSVLDLRTLANLRKVGLGFEDIARDDMAAWQLVGAAAHQLGLEGIWAPSATGAGEIFVVFVLNIQGNSTLSVAGTSEWRSLTDVPQLG
jgi:hypothetical protein